MLVDKLKNYDFEKLFKMKGYAFYGVKPYDLNIIGIRSNQGNRVTNQFDDYFVVLYLDDNKKWNRKIWKCTTEPGLDYVKNPLSNKGAAIVAPGQYRKLWKLGLHQGKYEALCQRGQIKVYRDGNKNLTYELKPETIENGIFGINMHRASRLGTTSSIGKYSAGCQVFANASDFDEMIKLAKKQIKYGCGDSFTYTLLNELDLI